MFQLTKEYRDGCVLCKFSYRTIVCGHESLQLFVFQTLIPNLIPCWGDIGVVSSENFQHHAISSWKGVSRIWKKMGTVNQKEFTWHSSTWFECFQPAEALIMKKMPHSHTSSQKKHPPSTISYNKTKLDKPSIGIPKLSFRTISGILES